MHNSQQGCKLRKWTKIGSDLTYLANLWSQLVAMIWKLQRFRENSQIDFLEFGSEFAFLMLLMFVVLSIATSAINTGLINVNFSIFSYFVILSWTLNEL